MAVTEMAMEPGKPGFEQKDEQNRQVTVYMKTEQSGDAIDGFWPALRSSTGDDVEHQVLTKAVGL